MSNHAVRKPGSNAALALAEDSLRDRAHTAPDQVSRVFQPNGVAQSGESFPGTMYLNPDFSNVLEFGLDHPDVILREMTFQWRPME